MTQQPQIKGSITALITPFTEDGLAIDEGALAQLAERQVKLGSYGIVPVGTTGESPTLSHEEHQRVIDVVVETVAGRIPVIAGTGSNSTAEAIRLTRYAARAGVDAALIVMPYYNKPSAAGLLAHYTAIHEATDIPLIIYNVPGRSCVEMDVATMAALSRLPRIIGVKDATGKLDRVEPQRAQCEPGFIQLSGEDGTALEFNLLGGVGCISVSSNIAVSECAAFQSACLQGDYNNARTLNEKLLSLHEAMFCETNPVPVKYAASLLGLCHSAVRLPLAPLSDAGKAQVRAALSGLGLV